MKDKILELLEFKAEVGSTTGNIDEAQFNDLADRLIELFDLPVVSESALNDDIELELRQRTQELPNKTTAGEKLYYEAGWRESGKHTKMLVTHSR